MLKRLFAITAGKLSKHIEWFVDKAIIIHLLIFICYKEGKIKPDTLFWLSVK